MLKKSILFSIVFIFQMFIGCTQTRPNLKHQYLLSKDMIINETGCGYGTYVADEQLDSKPETFWNGHDKELCKSYKPSLVINFLQLISVTDIFIFCKSQAEATISVNIQKTNAKVFSLNEGWNKISIGQQTSYINIALNKVSLIGEVLIDASQSYAALKNKNRTSNPVVFQEFLGTNAFVDVPLGLLEPFGCIREYHDWPDWNEPQKDSFHLSISKQGFDFANFYVDLNKLGKIVIPTLQKSPYWLTAESNVQAKPVSKGANALEPKSYSRHALYLNKFAKAFSPANKGNVSYFENWNEHDKWWETGVSYFTPYQYASMSSADFDGDMSKMGAGYGIKIEGENNKLVMAGLANPKIDYLHALKHWCDIHRKGSIPWKVINYHRYSNSAGLPDSKPIEGICPEQGNVYAEAKEIVEFRDRLMPDAEVWISEFGYDTENSPQQCKPIGPKTSELVQADWLIRSYLLLSAAGVDKAFQYMIRDFAKSGLYATSGLYTTTMKDTPYLRPAWNYINTLKNALLNSNFEKLSVDSARQLYTLTFADKSTPVIKSHVIWLGTQSGEQIDFDISGFSNSDIVAFDNQSPCGKRQKLSGKSIKISETPIVIQDGGGQSAKQCSYIKKLSINDLSCKDLNGIPHKSIIDEQLENVDLLFGLASPNPVSPWKTDYHSTGGNGIVFYLNTLKSIHSIQIFDGAGTGDIKISGKKDNDWIFLQTLSLNQYNKWKTIIVGKDLKEIKIEKVKGSPDIGEAIIYENVKY